MTRHIQAYFSEMNDAQSAATSLQALGAGQVQTDRSTAFEPSRDEASAVLPIVPQVQGAYGAPFTPQTGALMFTAFDDEGAQRMGDGDADATDAGEPVLTAVVDEALYEKAIDIITKHGGRVD